MRILSHLEPKAVFSFFEDMCAIPHGSGNTKAISDYVAAFARARGLRYIQDSANNVVIFKPGTPGYEDSPAVMLQGHLDMVAEKDPDCLLDLARDGLELFVDGDLVGARGTTLGADNGLGSAMMLAVLDSCDLPHPPIEAVFTTDEEVGMDGAAALDPTPLTARLLVNLDSEDEGVFTVSCAGGVRANCAISYAEEGNPLPCYALSISGLSGGHSGVEIHKGRANANILMGRLLDALRSALPDLRLVSIQGGLKDNAIPVASRAVVAVSNGEALTRKVHDLCVLFRDEYAVSDPAMSVEAAPAETAATAMDADSTGRVIDFLVLAPDGVHTMSMDIQGLVQTSSNLGILKSEGGILTACSAIRSSVTSQKQMVYGRFQALCRRLGGSVSPTGDYPGWAYRRESHLRDTAMAVFRDQYGYEPKVEAIHAGLECGLFADKLPDLDAISIGPALQDIHTTRERLFIGSAQRTWEFLCRLLQALQ